MSKAPLSSMTLKASLQDQILSQENVLLDDHIRDSANCHILSDNLAQALERSETVANLSCHCALGQDIAQGLAKGLARNISLLVLDLANSQIGHEGGQALAQALHVNTTLRSIVLGSNNIGTEGAQALAASLQDRGGEQEHQKNMVRDINQSDIQITTTASSPSLTKLDLNTNNIGIQGATFFAQALQVNYSLQELNLDHNHLGDRGACAIAQALLVNTSLKVLHLQGNEIGPQGTIALAQALRGNSSLQSLYLADNSIGVEGAISLAMDALHFGRGRTPKALTTLDLACTNIGCEGVTAIATALQQNNNVSWLNLEGNRLGVPGVQALARSLSGNKSTRLRFLGLANNRIGHVGSQVLAKELIARNTSLTSLVLNRNPLGQEGIELIVEALATSNLSLHFLEMAGTTGNATVAPSIIDIYLRRNRFLEATKEIFCLTTITINSAPSAVSRALLGSVLCRLAKDREEPSTGSTAIYWLCQNFLCQNLTNLVPGKH